MNEDPQPCTWHKFSSFLTIPHLHQSNGHHCVQQQAGREGIRYDRWGNKSMGIKSKNVLDKSAESFEFFLPMYIFLILHIQYRCCWRAVCSSSLNNLFDILQFISEMCHKKYYIKDKLCVICFFFVGNPRRHLEVLKTLQVSLSY